MTSKHDKPKFRSFRLYRGETKKYDRIFEAVVILIMFAICLLLWAFA